MCLTFSLFLPISMSHLVLGSSIENPLDWFDPLLSFYHYIQCIRRFLAKSHVHMREFNVKLCVYVTVTKILMYRKKKREK